MTIPCIPSQHWLGLEFGVFANVFARGERFYEHRHEFNEFFLITEGALRQRKNGLVETMAVRSLCFNYADDQHDLETSGGHDHVHLLNCTFSDRILASAADFVVAAGITPPAAGWSRLLKDIPNEIWQVLANKAQRLIFQRGSMSPAIQEGLFKSLLVDVLILLAEPARSMTAAAPNWLVRLREKMQKEENFIAGLDRMIELCGHSQEHLTRNMRRYYGETPTEFINRLRIHKAAEMLLQSRYNNVAVMLECGFNNYAWFLRCFRRYFGMSPLQYVKFNRQIFAKRYSRGN